jgi:hypothetical protein
MIENFLVLWQETTRISRPLYNACPEITENNVYSIYNKKNNHAEKKNLQIEDFLLE